MAAIPELKKLVGSHKDHGMVLISIHCDQDAKKGVATAKEKQMTWPVTQDIGDKTQKAYAIDGYPTMFVIDRKGKIRFVDPPNLDKAVTTLLSEK